jgi:WhiB family redox-sensing transcriptional regulator
MSPDLHHLNNQWASTEPHREPADLSWAELAACKGSDNDLWFPERGDNGIHAKAVCWSCPVRLECLTHAMEHNEREGIWGGYSARQRSRMKEAASRRRKPINHGTQSGYHAHQRRSEEPCRQCLEANALANRLYKDRKAGRA